MMCGIIDNEKEVGGNVILRQAQDVPFDKLRARELLIR
jgi:hypothetical protein